MACIIQTIARTAPAAPVNLPATEPLKVSKLEVPDFTDEAPLLVSEIVES